MCETVCVEGLEAELSSGAKSPEITLNPGRSCKTRGKRICSGPGRHSGLYMAITPCARTHTSELTHGQFNKDPGCAITSDKNIPTGARNCHSAIPRSYSVTAIPPASQRDSQPDRQPDSQDSQPVSQSRQPASQEDII